MSLKNADVCYGCGEKWEHANEYNHYCTMCRYKNRLTVHSNDSGEKNND